MAQHLDAMVLELNPLMPPDAFYYFPKEDEVKIGNGAKALRRIFQGQIEFDDFEKNHIQKMKEHLSKHKVEIPEWWEDGHILRFLYANSFKYDKTQKTIKNHTEWRVSTLPIDYSPEIEDFLNKGVFYMHGRDERFRPIIVIDVSKINMKEAKIEQILQAMTYFFEYILKFTMLPGQIENWVVIMDLNKIGVSSLPISALKSVMSYLSNNYRSRMFATYVINTPGSIYIPWSIIKGFLEETTIKKISFSKDGNPKNLFNHTNKSQVESKFGGTAQNSAKHWPPKEISPKYQVNENPQNNLLISHTEYYTLWETGKLKKNIVCYNYLQDRHNKVPMNQIHINDVEQSVINLSNSVIPNDNILQVQQNQDFTKSQFYRIDSAPRSQNIRPKKISQSINQLIKSQIQPQNDGSNSKELQDYGKSAQNSEKEIYGDKNQSESKNFLNGLTKKDSFSNATSQEGMTAHFLSMGIKSGEKSQQIEEQNKTNNLGDSNHLKINGNPSTSTMQPTIAETSKSINTNQYKLQQTFTSQDLQQALRKKTEPSKRNELEQSLSISISMDIPIEKIETHEFNRIRNIRTNVRNGRSIMDNLNQITCYGKNY